MSGDKAVKLRVAQIQGEYRRTAQKVDRDLGFADGDGPKVKRLGDFPPVLDLVFGAWAECSDGVKRLLEAMVETKLASQKLQKGSPGEAKERSHTTRYMRRRLSSVAIRANVRFLLERMVQVGDGGGQAPKRRRWARREEERERWSRDNWEQPYQERAPNCLISVIGDSKIFKIITCSFQRLNVEKNYYYDKIYLRNHKKI